MRIKNSNHDLNLELNSDILEEKGEKEKPKFKFSEKTMDILKDLELSRKTNSQIISSTPEKKSRFDFNYKTFFLFKLN